MKTVSTITRSECTSCQMRTRHYYWISIFQSWRSTSRVSTTSKTISFVRQAFLSSFFFVFDRRNIRFLLVMVPFWKSDHWKLQSEILDLHFEPLWSNRICFRNGICVKNCSNLTWEKNVLVIEKTFWNLRLKAENLQKFWDHYNNLFKQGKVRINLW